jgi:uncharacterized delta-60 repeat protein
MRLLSWLRNRNNLASAREILPAARRRFRPCLQALEDRCLLSAGQLDPTFGSGGSVISDAQQPTSTAAAALTVTQPDGKVIIAGTDRGHILVARYDSDGSLDTTFGNQGRVSFRFTAGLQSIATAVALDGCGQIVVEARLLGFSTLVDGTGVARFNTDGSVDTGFGTSGQVAFALGGAEFSNTAGLAIDPLGRIVVAGNTLATAQGDQIVVARLTPTGGLDPSFGSGGQVIGLARPFGSSDAMGVAVDGDSRIFVATTNFIVARLTATGTLDSMYGSGGQTTITPGFNGIATGLAVDATGGAILTGTVGVGSFFGGEDIAVARLTSTGTMDSSFGSGGATTINLGAGGGPLQRAENEAAAVAVDPLGGLVVAGRFTPSNNPFAVAVVHLSSTGTLDSSFGSNGAAFSALNDGQSDSALGMAVTPDGRVLVSDSSGTLDRFTSTGLPDDTWGLGGRVAILGPTLVPTIDSAVGLTTTQPDGKLIVVGTSNGPNLSVARYNADGSLDTSFNGDGVQRILVNSILNLDPSAVTVDGSGRIVVVGHIDTVNRQQQLFAALRLNADGTPDATFGNYGLATFSVGSGSALDGAAGVAIDASNRIVIVGSTYTSSTSANFAVARLNAGGSLDSSFGNGGVTTIDFGGLDTAAAVALDTTGDILVAGTTDANAATGADFAVARLTGAGALDSSFGAGGKVTLSIGTGATSDHATGLALDPAGRIVVAGTTGALSGPVAQFAVARLTSTGTPDSTFGSGGQVTASFGSDTFNVVAGVAVDAAGRIAVAGTTSSSTTSFAVALFEASGRPDPDFGTAGQMTTHVGGTSAVPVIDRAAGVVFDAAGRLVVAGTAASQFALVRYLAHDPVVAAGSSTFAADLQAAVTALDTTTPIGTPRVVIHVSTQAQMAQVAPALAGLTVNPTGPTLQILLDVDPGAYSLGQVSVPAGLQLLLDGDGGAAGTFTGSNTAALTVAAGIVVIDDGAAFAGTGSAPALVIENGQVTVQDATLTASGNAPTIRVQGGQLSLRNSTVQETTGGNQPALDITGGLVDLGDLDQYGYGTGGNTIDVNGPGLLIRNTGPNDVSAFGDTFESNGAPLYDNFQIEDAIDHSLDGLPGGTVFWVPDSVFVTVRSGSVQRGVDVVPAGGSVNVQAGVHGDFNAGAKLLTVFFADGSSITQQSDDLDPTQRSLVVMGTSGNDTIRFEPGTDHGIRVKLNDNPHGTFLPTGRLIAYGQDGSDDIRVDGSIHLSAWLVGGISGNNYLQGGGGNDVLIGGFGNDTLLAGNGRDLLIGNGGNDVLRGQGGDDILIAAATSYGAGTFIDEVSLAALMAEWTSADSYATRVNDLVNGGGLNGATTLSPDDTVQPNGGSSVLDGGGGQDLFFDGASDRITGQHDNETVFSL